MYGDQFGEFVCGYWSLKGKNVHMTVYNYDLHQLFLTEQIIAELHPRAKRARGWSPIAKEMW